MRNELETIVSLSEQLKKQERKTEDPRLISAIAGFRVRMEMRFLKKCFDQRDSKLLKDVVKHFDVLVHVGNLEGYIKFGYLTPEDAKESDIFQDSKAFTDYLEVYKGLSLEETQADDAEKIRGVAKDRALRCQDEHPLKVADLLAEIFDDEEARNYIQHHENAGGGELQGKTIEWVKEFADAHHRYRCNYDDYGNVRTSVDILLDQWSWNLRYLSRDQYIKDPKQTFENRKLANKIHTFVEKRRALHHDGKAVEVLLKNAGDWQKGLRIQFPKASKQRVFWGKKKAAQGRKIYLDVLADRVSCSVAAAYEIAREKDAREGGDPRQEGSATSKYRKLLKGEDGITGRKLSAYDKVKIAIYQKLKGGSKPEKDGR